MFDGLKRDLVLWMLFLLKTERVVINEELLEDFNEWYKKEKETSL